ncbi:hypothetical protein IG631_14708 [Alternaria alternata]|nr:hypothetical protein IG631_14708 [Alternaria alternata]
MRLPDSDEMKGAEKQGRAVQVVGQFLKRVRDLTRECDPRNTTVQGSLERCGVKLHK